MRGVASETSGSVVSVMCYTRFKRNTRVFFLLQHLVRCAECGLLFGSKSNWRTSNRRNGLLYWYDRVAPLRYYVCYGMQKHRLRCREHSFIKADRLEEVVWNEVKQILQDPGPIVAGIEALDTQEGDTLR